MKGTRRPYPILRVNIAILVLLVSSVYAVASTWLDLRAIHTQHQEFVDDHLEQQKALLTTEVDEAAALLRDEFNFTGDIHAPSFVRLCNHLRARRFANDDILFAANWDQPQGMALFGAFPFGTQLESSAPPESYDAISDNRDYSRNGGGFRYYQFNDALEPDRRLKIAYVAPWQPWNGYVGAGMYVPDIEETLAANENDARQRIVTRLVGTGLTVLLVLIAIFSVMKDNRALRNSERSLRSHRALLRDLFAHAADPIFLVDEHGVIIDVNEQACASLNAHRDELIGDHMRDIDPEFDRTSDPDAELMYTSTLSGRHNTALTAEMHVSVLERADQRLRIALARDISDRIEHEERMQRMMAELDHRVKNTLASVLALMRRSAATAVDLPTFTKSLEGRLVALARTHEALAVSHWNSVEIRDVVKLSVGSFGDLEDPRFTLDGPELQLPPRTASPLCMTLHELATNALKYGALTEAGGAVNIAWSCDNSIEQVTIRWTEHNGPEITEPDATGFGTSLIKGLVEYELGGSVELEFPTTGAQCTITIPVDTKESDTDQQRESHQQARTACQTPAPFSE